MDISALSALCISVLKDIRIIAAAVFTIFFISLGNYVVNYRKRPPKIRRQKAEPKPAETKAPEEPPKE
ncbi:hypothetical protein [Treponema sp.]|uniref:hypothetical protein n=1 Tax=Treponema sp. TaxID=166 RepID=UPI003F04CB0C